MRGEWWIDDFKNIVCSLRKARRNNIGKKKNDMPNRKNSFFSKEKMGRLPRVKWYETADNGRFVLWIHHLIIIFFNNILYLNAHVN